MPRPQVPACFGFTIVLQNIASHLAMGTVKRLIQGVLILCAQMLTTYKIIIGEHCGVILFVKF